MRRCRRRSSCRSRAARAEEWAPVVGRWALRRQRAEARLSLDRARRQELALGDERRGGARALAAAGARGPRAARGPLRLRGGRRDRATAATAPTPRRWRCGPGPSDCATPPSRSESSTPGARCWRAARATAARSAACSGSSDALPGQGDELAAHLQAERDRAVPLDSDLVRSYIELVESAAPATHRARGPDRACRSTSAAAPASCAASAAAIEAACELLLREAESLAERLTIAEVTVFGLLRPRQYAEVIRDAFDPFGRQARARAAWGEPGARGSSRR